MYCSPVERQRDEASPLPSPLDPHRGSGALRYVKMSMASYLKLPRTHRSSKSQPHTTENCERDRAHKLHEAVARDARIDQKD